MKNGDVTEGPLLFGILLDEMDRQARLDGFQLWIDFVDDAHEGPHGGSGARHRGVVFDVTVSNVDGTNKWRRWMTIFYSEDGGNMNEVSIYTDMVDDLLTIDVSDKMKHVVVRA